MLEIAGETLLRTGLMAAVLAVVHLLAGKLRFLHVIPRSRWLSAAGGVSVAYVFLALLPELHEGQIRIDAGHLPAWMAILEHHVFWMALVGLSLFYGLERVVRIDRHRRRARGQGDKPSPAVFWLHLGSFAVYNGAIGYLLVHGEYEQWLARAAYFVAMALHFVVNDYGLRERHEDDYHRLGRWLLAGAVLVGWGVACLTEIHELAIVATMAFIGGGVILNVLKEELPSERESRFWAFAVGAALFAGITLLY